MVAGSGTTSIGAAAATVNYCFQVTLPLGADNGAQGQTLEQVWNVYAESN